MFKKFVTASLLKFISYLINGNLIDEIKMAVKSLMSEEMPGEEKRKKVLEHLDNAKDDVKKAAEDTSGYLINTAIEVATTYYKERI